MIVAHSNYNEHLSEAADLATDIINELKGLGVNTTEDAVSSAASLKNGLLKRPSDDGTTYPNGDITDWYGITRWGLIYNITSILVEHAYLSVEEDYRAFLSSDEKLKALAEADARDIANYYNFKRKDAKKSTKPQ